MRSRAEKKSSTKYLLVNCLLIIFCLYVAREVFIPIALAVLLSFILISLIDALNAFKFPRIVAIWLSVAFALFFFAILGWAVYIQALELSQNIPNYESNVQSKIHRFNTIHQHIFSNLNKVTSALKGDFASPIDKGKREPIPVELLSTKESIITQIMQFSPILSSLGTGLLSIIFLLYILFNRQNLRERFILLISRGDLNLATQAIDDTAKRITRYLLINLSINGTLGMFIAIGLYVIGVPNAFLWGLLTLFLRFIPYLGIWIAASFPLFLAFAVDPGWSMLFMTIALYIGAELAVNYFMEPRLYGASTGISSIAVLGASVFWTWLWGVVGLFLSVPLTVCIYMLGKYVAGLEFLEIILGSEPLLSPSMHLYQRLLAMDHTESLNISKQFLKQNTMMDYYDLLLIPTLILAKQDRFNGSLAENRQKFILEESQKLIDLVATGKRRKNLKQAHDLKIICIAARDEFDELVAKMLAHCLHAESIGLQIIECMASTKDIKTYLKEHKAPILCISSLPPYALSPARYLYRKIKKIQPSHKIVIGIWTAMPSIMHLQSAWDGSAGVVISLKESITLLKSLLGLSEETKPKGIQALEKQLKKDWDTDLSHIPSQELSLTLLKKIAKSFNVPISLISILETDPYFWKMYPGIMPVPNEAQENLLQSSVCQYVVSRNETLLVPNIKKDNRFNKDTWLIDRGIRFFIGSPLQSDAEHVVGILCLIDTKARDISKDELLFMESLAKVFMQKLEGFAEPK